MSFMTFPEVRVCLQLTEKNYMEMSPHEFIWILLLAGATLRTSVSKKYAFTTYPGVDGVARGDVGQSAALEWTLNMEPERYHMALFYFQEQNVFGYEPRTDQVLNRNHSSYDKRFSINKTSPRGIGFLVEELGPGDAGNYTCFLRGLDRRDDISHSAVLFEYEFPNYADLTSSQTDNLIEEKSMVDMSCTSTSRSLPAAYRPAMLYTWLRNTDRTGLFRIDGTNQLMNHEVAGERGETLTISPVYHTDHQATYKCSASEDGTQLRSPDSDPVTLEVLYGPYVITTDPANPRASVGETVSITAIADCNPRCRIYWTNGTNRPTYGETLMLVVPENATTYMVTAENTYGKICSCITIAVHTVSTCPVMAGVLGAIACISIIGNITLLILLYRNGGCPCSKELRAVQTYAVYENAEVIQDRQVTVEPLPTEVNRDYERVDTRTREPPIPSGLRCSHLTAATPNLERLTRL